MIELAENQIFIYKQKLKNLKLPIREIPFWSGWKYIAQLPEGELIAKSLKQISLKLSKDKLLIEKFKGVKFGKLEVATDKSLNYNKMGFNGSCYYQKSGLTDIELKKIYYFLNNSFYYFGHKSSHKDSENIAFWRKL